jgi:DNA-binding NtrC family response regulator
MRFVEGKSWMLEKIRRRLSEQTPSLAILAERLALAASHNFPILLTGESGTGKTFLARFIHTCSARCKRPFVVVPCSALPDTLIHSELFGHVAGAFTGADSSKPGRLAAAGAGTLLLDDIDSLKLNLQSSLLRLVETGEYEPVGSHATEVCAARLIVASTCDLDEAVQGGRFRSDLRYRLQVLPIHLPPLRERRADIVPLARALTARFRKEFGHAAGGIGGEALAALEKFSWPGNLRQLVNAVQQAVLVSRGAEVLPTHLPEEIHKDGTPNLHPRPVIEAPARLQASAEGIELKHALEKWHYHRKRTAKALGISRVTLWKKMKTHGLLPKRGRPR